MKRIAAMARGGLATLVLIGGLSGAARADGPMAAVTETMTVERAYDDVRFDVENAIIDRGLVIDYVSHIGDMLARTGADVGSDVTVYTRAETMLFCSARLSRAAMQADAANIAYCPYGVFLFETPDAPGMVTVGYRKLQETGSEASKAALAEVNALLAEIVAEAAGE
ncbi:DUF302 domain-containing protein [Stappia sp.]|uniref:DUF302 domain-containing protein n=1 Tax=Stappia sp. TaxID=1870903 RepID=UPI0032D962A9